MVDVFPSASLTTLIPSPGVFVSILFSTPVSWLMFTASDGALPFASPVIVFVVLSSTTLPTLTFPVVSPSLVSFVVSPMTRPAFVRLMFVPSTVKLSDVTLSSVISGFRLSPSVPTARFCSPSFSLTDMVDVLPSASLTTLIPSPSVFVRICFSTLSS